MKKNTSTLILALTMFSIFPTLAHGHVLIVGSGIAYSETPPKCDDDSVVKAKEAADQDADQQCSGIKNRISEYALKCDILVHGYVARTHAIATYECESETVD